MVFYAAVNSISVISRRQLTLFMLSFTSTRLGSEVSFPKTLPRKNPEDLVWLEPRTPGLRVKHFTTEPRGTLERERDRVMEISCTINQIFYFPLYKNEHEEITPCYPERVEHCSRRRVCSNLPSMKSVK